MNICLPRVLLTAAVTVIVATPMAGLAANGTITFTGAITENSCTVSVDSGGDLTLGGCKSPGQVAIYVEAGPQADPATDAVKVHEVAGTWHFYAGYALATAARAGTGSTVTYSLVYQ